MKVYCYTTEEAMKLGARARRLAERKGLRNKDIAERLDVKQQSAISRLWLGQGLVCGTKIAKICRALECTPNELLGWEDGNE